MRLLVFATLLMPFCLLSAQAFRSTAIVTSPTAAVNTDLTGVISTAGSSVTIRNSSTISVDFPQISSAGTPWPYSISYIKQELAGAKTDEEVAMATWRFVVRRNFHYCSAGTNTSETSYYATDPRLELTGFGFGCCDQLARELAWIWLQLGYQSRIAVLTFHTVAEIYYAGAWHLFDPDHEVYYRNADGSVASLADILSNPLIVANTKDANGNDPVGFSAAQMAQWYVDYAPSLLYKATGYWTNSNLVLRLRPQEQLTIHDASITGTSQRYDYGDPFSFRSVNSGELSWDVTFADPNWNKNAYSTSGLVVVANPAGTKFLQNASGVPGYVIYKQSSVFPVLAASIAAQIGSGDGSLKAYYSRDGVHWSDAVSLVSTNGESSFPLSADISAFAVGQYEYYIKIELVNNIHVHRMRLKSVVQMSKTLFPGLRAGLVNQSVYMDGSKPDQARNIRITTTVPIGNPQLHGLSSESLVPEDSTYSLARDYGASNLVDENPDSLAYPGARHIDYAVHLNGFFRVTGVAIDWGLFGLDSRYVQSWSLYSRIGSEKWQLLSSGSLPRQATQIVAIDTQATDLRIVADSANWIGIYDLKVFGTTMPWVPASQLSASSFVVEDAYSTANHLLSASLVDRDSTTLAYPGSSFLDYVIALKNSSTLNAAIINWGVFGTNPIYISSWKLSGRSEGTNLWTTLASGAFPNSSSSIVGLNGPYNSLRLQASSNQNWIGVYDVNLFGSPEAAFPELGPITASSNTIEYPTVQSFMPASNLTDGDENSLAYPVSSSFDYTLDLGKDSYIDSLNIDWGVYGADPVFINSWQLYGLPVGSTTWELVKVGDFPNDTHTIVPVGNRYAKLRVVADSTSNWIGIFEVHVLGLQ